MMTPQVNEGKINPFLLSNQVKRKLQEKGYSKVFNYADYDYYKRKVKDAFNKVNAIVDLFIQDNMTTNQSDYQDYIF